MSTNITETDEIWNTFLVKYSESGLKIYNEEYFKQFGLNSHVTVVVNGDISDETISMKGGVRHSSHPRKNEDYISVTVPYSFFYHKMKYMSDTLSDSFKPLTHTINTIANKPKSNNKPVVNKNTDYKIDTVRSPITQPDPVVNVTTDSISQPSNVSQSNQSTPSSGILDSIKTSIQSIIGLNNTPTHTPTPTPTTQPSIGLESDINKQIKIEIEGDLTEFNPNKYESYIGLSKFYMYLWMNQKSITDSNVYVINNKVLVLGTIEDKEESIFEMFKREHPTLDINKYENTEAYKIINL